MRCQPTAQKSTSAAITASYSTRTRPRQSGNHSGSIHFPTIHSCMLPTYSTRIRLRHSPKSRLKTKIFPLCLVVCCPPTLLESNSNTAPVTVVASISHHTRLHAVNLQPKTTSDIATVMFDAPIFLPFRAVCCQPTAATVMVEAWTLCIICFCNSRNHLRDRDSCGWSTKGLCQLGLRKQHLMADRKQSRSIFRFLADGSYCCQWNSVKELWPSSI